MSTDNGALWRPDGEEHPATSYMPRFARRRRQRPKPADTSTVAIEGLRPAAGPVDERPQVSTARRQLRRYAAPVIASMNAVTLILVDLVLFSAMLPLFYRNIIWLLCDRYYFPFKKSATVLMYKFGWSTNAMWPDCGMIASFDPAIFSCMVRESRGFDSS